MPRFVSRRALCAAFVAVLSLGAALTSSGVMPPAASAGTVVVEVTDDAGENPRFAPAVINIVAGDTVDWQWTGDLVHTVTRPDDPESFDSGIGGTGSSFSHTFNTAGSYLYLCGIHAEMAGTVNVAPAVPGLWTPTNDMTTPRTDDATVLLADGSALTIGGINSGFAQPSAERYSPISNAWDETDPMSSPRAKHSATTLLTGEVLVAGGNESAAILLGSALVYDPVLDNWSGTGSMAVRQAHEATLLDDGRVLMTGGQTKNAGSPFVTATADVYDRGSDGFAAAGSMSDARMFHSATLLGDGRVLVAGGADEVETLATAELYDPDQNLWSPAAPLSTLRALAAAVRLPDGRVLVTGGRDIFSPGAHASAELYDPILDEWSDAANMAQARSGHTATVMSDGRVLVAGGEDENGAIASAEIYDPTLDEWQFAPSMIVARSGHDAVRVGNETVLVVGGTGADAGVPQAEFFMPLGPADDGDGIPPEVDNCPTVANADQLNTDAAPRQDPGALLSDTSIPTEDALGDACDDDDDNDGLDDSDESTGCTGDPTDPLVADTDGDRIVDGVECVFDSDPADAQSRPLLPSPEDDADGDSLPDEFETALGSDPNAADSDGDGVTDGVELKGYLTLPMLVDTDGDGCDDGQEIASVDGSSPVNSIDLLLVAQRFGATDQPVHDVDKNGQINSIDLLVLASNFAPAACGVSAS